MADITPERIAELRELCNVPSAEMVARARLRTFRKRTDALTTLGLSLHALPELLDEIDRLRAVIRETHAHYCAGEPRYAAGKLHAPECLLREIEP